MVSTKLHISTRGLRALGHGEAVTEDGRKAVNTLLEEYFSQLALSNVRYF